MRPRRNKFSDLLLIISIFCISRIACDFEETSQLESPNSEIELLKAAQNPNRKSREIRASEAKRILFRDDLVAPNRKVLKKKLRKRKQKLVSSENINTKFSHDKVKTKVLRRRKVLRPEDSLDFPADIKESQFPVEDNRRNARFFSIFTVVRFNNDACPTNSGENGTCYPSADCSARGGKSDGTCASGFGVCCLFEFQCGRTTSENGTYFVSPSTPQRICNLMINRKNDDICQIKLELDTFDIAGPDANGLCSTDFFLATGGSEVPQLCGLNSGQHVIYSITSNSGPTQISMVLDTTVTATSSRSWKIRIYQYECSSRNLAPVGCLQYHTSASGLIKSFNYKTEVEGTLSNHLGNLNYAVCVRVENGYCGIRYAQVVNDVFSFTLSGTVPTTMTAITPGNEQIGDTCTSDYVIISNGSEDGMVGFSSRDRYCGLALGRCERTTANTCTNMIGPVSTYSKPFVLSVVTDSMEEGTDSANRGFSLTYNQLPCLGRIGR